MRMLTSLIVVALLGCGGSAAELTELEPADAVDQPQQLGARYRFRVIDWNIAGKSEAFALLESQIAEFKPDAVLLQEVCLSQKQAWASSHPNWDVRFTQMTAAHPGCGDAPKGVMLASPRAMADVFAADLGESYDDPDLQQTKHYKLLCGKVSTGKGRVKVCTTHLRVSDAGAAAARLVLTQRIVARVFPAGIPVVVGGDFNAGKASPEMAVMYDRFLEADRGDNTPTHRNAKIDYLFFDKQHVTAKAVSGGVITQDISDHHLYRGWADLTL